MSKPSARPAKDAAKLRAANEQIQDATDGAPMTLPAEAVVGGRPTTGAAAEFPAQYFTKSEIEDRLDVYKKAHQQFVGDGADKLFAKAQMPDDLVKWMHDKQTQEELAKFEDWLMRSFDLNDPLVVRMLNEMYPDYLERRLEQLDSDADMMKRLAKLRLQGGPKSREDLLLGYLLASGQVNVDRLLTKNLIFPAREDPNDGMIRRGWFNPRKWAGDHATVPGREKADWLSVVMQGPAQNVRPGRGALFTPAFNTDAFTRKDAGSQ